MTDTLLLTRSDIEKVLTPGLANDTVERAFRAHGLGQVQMPPKSYLYFPRGDLRSMPASLEGEGFDCAGIKCVTVHPENRDKNLPAVMGLILLNDPETGFPLAVMDGTFLTGMRTGASGALSAKYLSRKNSEIVGFVGCGVQARTQLACLLEVRKIRAVKIWEYEADRACARDFMKWVKETHGLETMVSPRMEDVTMEADIVVTTTPSRTPLVTGVSPGTHITAIGADAPGKQEICPLLLRQAKIVVDDRKQASHSGEINVPLAKGDITRKQVYARLGDIVAEKKRGRTSDEEITLFDSTGLAILDISCASVVYRKLHGRSNVETADLLQLSSYLV